MMKITKSQLIKLIQESLEEVKLEQAELGEQEEEETITEQDDEDGEEADLEEAIEETWGGARSGSSATRGIGGNGGGGDRGVGQLAAIAARDAKKKAAIASSEQHASDMESMKKNPFKPTQTGMRAMGLAEAKKVIAKLVMEEIARRKAASAKKQVVKESAETMIRKLVQEVLAEGAAKPKKPATDPKKKPAPKKK